MSFFSFKLNKLPIFFLIFVIIYAFFFLNWSGPKVDESLMANAPYNLIHQGVYGTTILNDICGFDKISFINLPVYQILLILVFKLLPGVSPLIAGRLLSLSLFMGSCFILMRLFKIYRPNNEGGSSRTLMAMTVFMAPLSMINSSLIIRPEMSVVFFSLMAFYFWKKSETLTQNSKYGVLFIAGLCASLSALSHLPGLFIIPSLFLFQCLTFKTRKSLQDFIYESFYLILGVLIPMAIYSVFIWINRDLFYQQVFLFQGLAHSASLLLKFKQLMLQLFNVRSITVTLLLGYGLYSLRKIQDKKAFIIIIGLILLNFFFVNNKHPLYIVIFLPWISMIVFMTYQSLRKSWFVGLFIALAIFHSCLGVAYITKNNWGDSLVTITNVVGARSHETVLAPAMFWFDMKNSPFTALEEYEWWTSNRYKAFCNIPRNKYNWIVLTSTYIENNPAYQAYFNAYKQVAIIPIKGVKYMEYAVVLNRLLKPSDTASRGINP